MGSTWNCIYCMYREETPIELPPKEKVDDWHHFWQQLRRRCPKCGRFLLPREIWEELGGKYSLEFAYRNFSHCPCAYQCHLFELYTGECETGQIRVECLDSIHRKLEIIAGLVSELHKNTIRKPRQRRSQKPPVPSDKEK